MNCEFEGLRITCENDLHRPVERMSGNTEFAKQFEKYGIMDEHIDAIGLIRMYREKIRVHDRGQFRKEHECIDCVDYLVKSCKGIAPCKYENTFQREEDDKDRTGICPMDKTGSCPYGRPEGICIGLPSCYREVIEGIRGGKGRNESNKEAKKDG